MSCDCQEIYIKKPLCLNLEEDGNVKFEIGVLLYVDPQQLTPYNLADWTIRGAIGQRNGNSNQHLIDMTASIIMDASSTLCYGFVAKDDVLGLPQLTPLTWDLSVDNPDTKDSFCIAKGTLIFNPGVSS